MKMLNLRDVEDLNDEGEMMNLEFFSEHNNIWLRSSNTTMEELKDEGIQCVELNLITSQRYFLIQKSNGHHWIYREKKNGNR